MSERVTFPRVLRSELTKLVSLRSTWFSLGGVVLLTVSLAGVVGYGIDHDGEPPADTTHAVAASFLPLDFLVLVVAVLGVLQMTGEYNGGAARATFAAVPRRWPVVLAKAGAFVAVTAPVMAVTAVASFLVCQAFLGDDGVSLGDPGVPGQVAGAAASTVLLGLLGLAVGTSLRHSAAAISTLVAVLFIVPVLLGPVLPGDREDDVLKFLPTVAGQAMYGSLGGADSPFPTLSAGASALVLVAWVAAALAAGTAVLVRRDV